MRSLFAGYYRPTEAEFRQMWQDGLFAFDANLLLNVYRYTDKTRDRFIEILDRLSLQLWLPYHVACEFHRDRPDVVWSQQHAYGEVCQSIEKAVCDVEKSLGKYRRHSFINPATVLEPLTKARRQIEKELRQLEESHPLLGDGDPFLDRITDLFDGKVGPPYPEDRLEQIHKDAKKRYEKDVPPGYEDAKKPEPERYGDYVIWCQLIDRAKAAKKPVIFITDDVKTDWWLELRGERKGPRPELRQEMMDKGHQPFYLYTGDRFIEQAATFLKLPSAPDVVEEVKDVREQRQEALSEG